MLRDAAPVLPGRTGPEPAVLLLLDCFDEMLTYLAEGAYEERTKAVHAPRHYMGQNLDYK